MVKQIIELSFILQKIADYHEVSRGAKFGVELEALFLLEFFELYSRGALDTQVLSSNKVLEQYSSILLLVTPLMIK